MYQAIDKKVITNICAKKSEIYNEECGFLDIWLSVEDPWMMITE